MSAKRKARLARVAHATAGANIALEGYLRLTEHEVASGIIILILGIAFIAYARFHPRLHSTRLGPHFETGVFLAEAVVIGLNAELNFRMGKHYIPWLYVFSACMYIGLAVRQHLSNRRFHAAH